MPVRRLYAKRHRNALRDEIAQDQLKPFMERFGKQLEGVLDRLIRRTLRFASQRGNVGFRDVRAKTTHTIQVDRRGGVIELNTVMIDRNGNPHKIWHAIEVGWNSYEQQFTVAIRERDDVRTIVDDLTVEPFPGYTGEWFTIVEGRYVAGIKARRWYNILEREFERELRKIPNTQDWVIKRADIKRPFSKGRVTRMKESGEI